MNQTSLFLYRHEQSLAIKVKVPSIGPICHHRHLIQDTFKRFLMTLQTMFRATKIHVMSLLHPL